MKRFVFVAVVVGLALAVQGAWALTLRGQIAYSWQSGWTANDDGTEYWDNPSSDGTPPGNIGYQTFVAGESYWGSAAGDADPDVYFTSAGPDWAAIQIEIAGLAPTNRFGVYKKDDPSEKYQLFDGAAGPGASVVFNPLTVLGSPDFGFYLENPSSTRGGIWYSQSQFNEYAPDSPGDVDLQHFVFFTAPPLVRGLNAYYIGVEDLRSASSPDWDYQDMVVYVANIPDASTWMLFLSGMPAVLMLRRRKS